MEAKELTEYEQREIDEVKRIRAGSTKTEIRDFYHEINLKPPYTSHLDPWWSLLPFYNTLVVGIAPLTEDDFVKKYRVSPKDLANLHSRGKIQLILRNKPTAFEGLDYLDDILEMRLPTYIRSIGYAEHSFGVQFEDLLEEGKELFGKEVASSEELNRFFGPIRNPTQVAGIFYAQLKALPSTRFIAENIRRFNTNLPDTAVFSSLLSGAILAGHVFGSLGGCHAVPLKWASKLEGKRELSQKFEVFPVDLAKELASVISLRLPEDFETALEVDSSRARKALFELDRAIQERQKTKMIDRALALRETLNEVNEAVSTIERHVSKAKSFASKASLAVGVAGPISGLFTDLPNLFGVSLGIASGATLYKATKKIVEMVDKLGMPNYVVSVYDIKSKLKNL